MSRLCRLALLLLPAALEAVLAVPPGHAQQGTESVRFAFADTTLLRDTLNLHFDRLFPLADSLMITPDSLRAQAIRFRLPLSRLVFLADSLHMPVDSVGSVMERERFNALALSRKHLAKFGYTSGYTVSGGTSIWTNNTDYNLRTGPFFLRNATSISLSRAGGGQLLSLNQDRSSTTEASWEVVRNLSLGARVDLQRNAAFSEPASIYDYSRKNDQYQMSVRARPRLAKSLTTELTFYGGPYTEPYDTYQKKGLNGVMNARVRYALGAGLYEDLSVQNTDKLGQATYFGHGSFTTHDFTRDVRSSLSVLEAQPASLRVDLAWRRDQAEKPDILVESSSQTISDTLVTVSDTSVFRRRDPSGSRSAQVQLRLRRDQDRYVIVSGQLAETDRLLSDSRNGLFVVNPTSTTTKGVDANARYALLGCLVEGHFTYSLPTTDMPRRDVARGTGLSDTTVDFREEQQSRARTVEFTLTRMLFRRVTIRATGHVSLTTLRNAVTDSSYRALAGGRRVQGTFDRDDYEQGYRISGTYMPMEKFNTTLSLDVSRRSQLVLPAAGSSSSNEVRSYRGEWSWSFRMMKGLTVTQLNQLGADYTDMLFSTDDALLLSYLTQTNLNAVLTPRLSMQVSQRSTVSPNGDFTTLPDGTVVFSPASERREYVLSASLSYMPAPVLTLSVLPYYSAMNSDVTSGSVAVPSQRQRSLTLGGGASLNLPVTAKGRLTGDIRRNFQAQRNLTYLSGVLQPSPRSERDYWDGSMQLTWEF